MGRIRFYARMDKSGFDRLTHQCCQESAERAANHTKMRIQQSILAQGRVNTGAMLRSIKIEQTIPVNPLRVGYKVGSNLPYYWFQNHGVKAHDARPGGVMVFVPKGGNHFVFARHVRGFPGGHFAEEAVRLLCAKDFYPL